MVNEIVKHNKPLAYIIGNQPFHPLPLPLKIKPPTLIPRPETEYWVPILAQRFAKDVRSSGTATGPLDDKLRILDIGTGSGCIPLALAFALKQQGVPVEAIGVDVADTAVSLARENVDLYGEWLGDSVEVRKADLFAADFVDSVLETTAGQTTFDLVVSNPPYIPRSEYATLDNSVKDWEDEGALLGDRTADRSDGLAFYERIVELLPRLVSSSRAESGSSSVAVAFEVGKGQHGDVVGLLEGAGYDASVVKDQWGVDRLVLGRRRPN
ncbi:hypothetical protein ACM66B_000378 [Microbotryomycetes sp. NB124-2]